MADDLGQIELCDPEAEHLLYVFRGKHVNG